MFKDKNTTIGFVLLGLLFFGFFTYTSIQQKKARAIAQKEQDSIAAIEAAKLPKVSAADSLKNIQDSINNQQQKQTQAAGSLAPYLQGTLRIDSIRTNLYTLYFSNKGGQPVRMVLHNYNNYRGKPVQLGGDSTDQLSYGVNNGTAGAIQSSQLYFETTGPQKAADGSYTIQYQAKDSSGRAMTHTYKVKPDSYLYDFNLQLDQAQNIVTQGLLSLTRQQTIYRQDNDLSFERQWSRLAYVKDGSFGSIDASGSNDKDFDDPVQWISFKQRFFNTTLMSETPFKNAKIECVKQPDSTSNLFVARSDMKLPVSGNSATFKMQIYSGPNDYKILNGMGHQMRNLVQLHSQPFGFVKWINRWLILPVFDFLLKNVGSVGLAIALLTIFIRLLTSPLMYPGYLTGAKMKVLRPELAKLREKYPDRQEYAMEQMKFMRQAGVNTFAGCLPSLLQIPIFFSLYALFTAHIGVRDEAFLWVKDLSQFDEFIKFGVNIPLLGDHIGLFTLTACFTSFLISWYGMSATPDQDNPLMKYLPYIFPVVMLFIFNNLPSSLTWYYTVSNLVTLGIQFVIQRYIINHDKVLAKIEEKRKQSSTKPKSKFQERYEQMMEAQKKVQEMKKKNQQGKS
jgi:YidC/Oxa1 family membrane protein insertase